MTSSGQPHSPDKLDILIDQVGHFTKGLTEFKLLVHEQAETAKQQAVAAQQQAETAKQQLAAIEKQGDRFDHIDERLDRVVKTAEQQSQNIDRITAAMEASNRSQAEAINRLVSVVDRLVPPLP
ncbi:hypothetical protein [Stenomitos frigidus]|uniref:Uncharacterized protein n=1 Tax=Stenomitos frigidus ULC18 TaxID=2107698 RepID=A0A2T1DWB9_9CYAN|nr:hypothetical protein [Stenomitos frigidus]PSB24762.1 hypothetical protein C7B82_25465 [Stenomitos frigidus ULC18]